MEIQEKQNAIASAEAVRAEYSQRLLSYPQWSGITPADVGIALQNYEIGDFSDCAMLMEAISKYDSQTATCLQKRFALSTSSDWEIALENVPEELKAQAEEQASVLRDFFNTVSVVDALARDAQHGANLLFQHIISAIAFGYSAAAVKYYPAKTIDGKDTVHATIMTCPLRFFEARTRYLRIRQNYADYDGTPLNPKQWIIAHSQDTALMLTLLPLHSLKSTPLEDWAQVVEKYGIPFVILNTPAAQGSPEWRAAAAAVAKVGSGFNGVFGSDVKLQISTLAQGNAPHERIIDYLDRAISRLILGSDLSVMSREGDAVGATNQSSAESILRKRDRAFIEAVIDKQVVRRILDLVFGEGTRQLAYFRFSTKEKTDASVILQKIQAAKEAGIPIPKSWIYSELGIPEPTAEEDVVFSTSPATTTTKTQNAQNGVEDAANAKLEKGLPPLPESVLNARKESFEKLIRRLEEMQAMESDEEFQLALESLHEDFGEIATDILSRDDVADALAINAIENSDLYK